MTTPPMGALVRTLGRVGCPQTTGACVIPLSQFAVIFLVVASVLGCSGAHGPTLAPHVTAAQQHSASASMGISLPPETQCLLYHRRSEALSLLPCPDDAVHLKIELPAATAAHFLAQAPFSTASWGGRWIKDMPGWPQWMPSRAKSVRSTQIQLPNARVLNVLVDEDREDVMVVFLEWFET